MKDPVLSGHFARSYHLMVLRKRPQGSKTKSNTEQQALCSGLTEACGMAFRSIPESQNNAIGVEARIQAGNL